MHNAGCGGVYQHPYSASALAKVLALALALALVMVRALVPLMVLGVVLVGDTSHLPPPLFPPP